MKYSPLVFYLKKKNNSFIYKINSFIFLDYARLERLEERRNPKQKTVVDLFEFFEFSLLSNEKLEEESAVCRQC